MVNQLFWEAVESRFKDQWDLFMSKVWMQEVVQLYVRAWDRTYQVRADGEIVYEGTSQEAVEMFLSDPHCDTTKG